MARNFEKEQVMSALHDLGFEFIEFSRIFLYQHDDLLITLDEDEIETFHLAITHLGFHLFVGSRDRKDKVLIAKLQDGLIRAHTKYIFKNNKKVNV